MPHINCYPAKSQLLQQLPLQKFLPIRNFVETTRTQPDNMADLFNSIGDKVDKVAPAAVVDGDDSEDRVVEEIESLCMHCEENVSRTHTG